MLVLALDSSSSTCAVCLWQDGHVLAQAHEHMERGQDARLMPMVVATLKQANVSFAQLDKIAVTRGPGSFTGVRVGLAAARGIGIASGKPVIGVNRFTICQKLYAQPNRNLLVIVQSKRTELFCQFFPATDPTPNPCMMSEEEIVSFLTAHPGTDRAGDTTGMNEEVISVCAELAAQADAHDPDFAPIPLYLRAPDVTMPPET